MRLGDWIFQDFTGGVPIDDPHDALRALLVENGGNVSALARELGRSRRTVRNWLGGTTPRGGGRELVAAAREALAGSRLDELRDGFETVTIGGTLDLSDPENRVLEIAFTPGYGDQLVDAYLNGAGPDELEALFVEGIADPWYADHLGNPNEWDTDWMSY